MSDISTDTKPTFREVGLSLTGFEEVATEKLFGALEGLGNRMAARAWLFVLKRREGMDDKSAYGMVMRMRIEEVTENFRDGNDNDENEDEAAEGND